MNQTSRTLRLGARGSLLSRLQSGLVARWLEQKHPGLKVELVVVKTSGDRITERPLHEFGGKGLFTKELEEALLDGEVDFAVHSFKDVPVTLPLVAQEGLCIAAVPAREDPRDVLVCGRAATLADLPPAARVGTGSLRRQAQVLALRPDLKVEPIRGNVDTRIKKHLAGEYEAVILALAGLHRSGLFDPERMHPIPTEQVLPAAQGALALQCRRADAPTAALLAALDDPSTALCVRLERGVVAQLHGDCHSPIAALAELTPEGRTVRLSVAVAARDGRPPILRASALAAVTRADEALAEVLTALEAQGARRLLHGP